MAVAVGDVLEVTVDGTIFSQRVMTVLHYKVGQTPTQTDPIVSQIDFLDLIVGGAYDIATLYRAATSSSYRLQRVWAQYIWPTRYVKSNKFVGLSGTYGSGSDTANVAGVIQKLSVFAGRKNRGSIHMPGVPAAACLSGGLDTPLISAYSALATQLMEHVIEGGGGSGRWDPVILHRTHPLNGTAVPWESFLPKDEVRVMRRRTLGVGI